MVEELLPGSDGQVQAVVVEVGDKSGGKKTVSLNCSIKHLEEKARSPLSVRVRQAVSKSSSSTVGASATESPNKQKSTQDDSNVFMLH